MTKSFALLFCSLLLLMVSFACKATAADFTREEAARYLALSAEQKAVQAKIADPATAPEEKAAMTIRSQQIDQELDDLETAVETRKNGAFLTGIANLLPGGNLMLGALFASLAPLLGPRGRKHFGNFIKSATPFTNRSSKNLLDDLMQYYGAAHSDPEDRPVLG